MTKELTDEQIKPLIPQDMDWRYVAGEAGALEFAPEVIKLDRAQREKNYALLTAYANQQHKATAEEMYERQVDAEEADRDLQFARHAEKRADYEVLVSNLHAENGRLKAACAKFSEGEVVGGVPDGWRLVPVVLTAQMLGKFADSIESDGPDWDAATEEQKQEALALFSPCYRAMLAAAP